MNSIIKRIFLGFFFLFTMTGYAQSMDTSDVERSDTIAANMRNFRPRLLSLSLNVYAPIPSGDQFIGQGFEGKIGGNFKAQLMIYKQFFLNVGLGQTYFSVKDMSVTGNYRSTRISNQYISVGYEFLPIDNIRLGISASVFGNAEYTNKFREGISVIQSDTAKLNIYELYVDYEIFYFMAVTVNYGYRNDKTNIDVPQELESTFERGQFHMIGFGLKFYLGDANLFQN